MRLKQDRLRMYIVTLTRVRANIVTFKKQKILHIWSAYV